MAMSVTGSTTVTYHPHSHEDGSEVKPLTANFAPPFRVVDMMAELRRLMPDIKLPPNSELHTEGAFGVKSLKDNVI